MSLFDRALIAFAWVCVMALPPIYFFGRPVLEWWEHRHDRHKENRPW